MITLINSTKTNVVFVNSGVLVHSISPPPPLSPLDTRVHKCGPRASPNELCGPLVGLSWPALI
jgi:hypothetical protein